MSVSPFPDAQFVEITRQHFTLNYVTNSVVVVPAESSFFDPLGQNVERNAAYKALLASLAKASIFDGFDVIQIRLILVNLLDYQSLPVIFVMNFFANLHLQISKVKKGEEATCAGPSPLSLYLN
jgi:hypothetical protein